MRKWYWRRPATTNHFLIVGSWLNGETMEQESALYPYLLLPSEFTSQLKDSDIRNQDLSAGHRGESYFRKVYEEDDLIPYPTPWPEQSLKRLYKGSDFMADTKINPMRYLQYEDAIYQVIHDMIYKKGLIRINCLQSTSVNREFDANKYLVEMREVHQAAWDYGCKYQTITTKGPSN